MKTQPHLTTKAEKQRHPRRPIKYYTANIKTNWIDDSLNEIGRHESLPILRSKFGNVGVVYKAHRA